MTHEQRAYRLTLAGVIAIGVIGAGGLTFTGLQGYWGYNCRYHGKLCESSVVAALGVAVITS
jgi:hypothetical protein